MPILRVIAAAAWSISLAHAAPLPEGEIAQLCAAAEDTAHCGRLIEEVQLKRLPNLARREGNALHVSLFPGGTATFIDGDDPVNGRSYSLWDFIDGINAVVLYTSAGDSSGYTLLQRASNRRFDLPAEPQLSPDRTHLVTADVCASRCVNEIAVWKVTRDGIFKELAWSPGAAWIDAAAKWKDAGTLAIDYTSAGAATGAKLERALSDPAWKRLPPP